MPILSQQRNAPAWQKRERSEAGGPSLPQMVSSSYIWVPPNQHHDSQSTTGSKRFICSVLQQWFGWMRVVVSPQKREEGHTRTSQKMNSTSFARSKTLPPVVFGFFFSTKPFLFHRTTAIDLSLYVATPKISPLVPWCHEEEQCRF